MMPITTTMSYLPFAFAACVVAVVIGGYIRSLHRQINLLMEQRERMGRLL